MIVCIVNVCQVSKLFTIKALIESLRSVEWDILCLEGVLREYVSLIIHCKASNKFRCITPHLFSHRRKMKKTRNLTKFFLILQTHLYFKWCSILQGFFFAVFSLRIFANLLGLQCIFTAWSFLSFDEDSYSHCWWKHWRDISNKWLMWTWNLLFPFITKSNISTLFTFIF